MKTTLASFATALTLALAALPGCATESDVASSEAATSTASVEWNKTKSFKGSYELREQGQVFKFDFAVTNIDWEEGTALFNSKILEGNGNDDVDMVMKIQTQRCPGCYVFEAYKDGERAIALTFTASELTSVWYFGFEARTAELKATSEESTPDAEPGTPSSGGGACSLVCSGEVYACKPASSAGACNADLFDSVPRCPHNFEFAAGASCN